MQRKSHSRSFGRHFRFTGDLYALREGTVMYPNTPVVTVVAPLIEAQIVETAILLEINHQSLIATKANRIVRAAQGRVVSDFPPRPQHRLRRLRRARLLHRRRGFHRHGAGRADVQYPRFRDDGALLGDVLPGRVHGL